MPHGPNPRISDPARQPPAELHSPLNPDDARAALTQAGLRGRLPGFARRDGHAFRLDCDAIPFDYELLGELHPADAGSRVTLRARRRPLMPWIFAVTLIFTVWPGVWLTDSLLDVYWTSYANWSRAMPWLTYAWYLPTTALPLPWLWRGLTGKSAAMAGESAVKMTEALRAVLAERA
jgi:hypothetical protein